MENDGGAALPGYFAGRQNAPRRRRPRNSLAVRITRAALGYFVPGDVEGNIYPQRYMIQIHPLEYGLLQGVSFYPAKYGRGYSTLNVTSWPGFSRISCAFRSSTIMWLSSAACTTSTSFLPSRYAQTVVRFLRLIAFPPLTFRRGPWYNLSTRAPAVLVCGSYPDTLRGRTG